MVFFEKLTKTLSRVAVQLPKYTDVLELSEQGDVKLSERLKWSISQIYVSLMRFLRDVVKIFTSENGGMSLADASKAFMDCSLTCCQIPERA